MLIVQQFYSPFEMDTYYYDTLELAIDDIEYQKQTSKREFIAIAFDKDYNIVKEF